MTDPSLLAHAVLSAAAAPTPSVLLVLGLACLAVGLMRRSRSLRTV